MRNRAEAWCAKVFLPGVLALLAVLLLAPAAYVPAEAPGDVAGGPLSTAAELKKLKARIAALEEAISRRRAEQETAKDGEKGQAPASLAEKPVVFSTAPWAKDERGPATAVAAEVDKLLDFMVKINGVGLVREMERLMAEGDRGHAVLQGFLHALDKDAQLGSRLIGKYDLAFALVHLAMLQEEGLARMAHAYFAATRTTNRTLIRSHLYNFLPVFLEFHRGRFPDLERDMKAEIFQLVRAGDKRLRTLLSAAIWLDYYPAIEVLEERLEAARDFQAHSALIRHLESRDDKDAVRVLRKFVIKNLHIRGGPVGQALVSLARMSEPAAEAVFKELTWTKDAVAYSKAVRAQFSVPRNEGYTPEARRYLNSQVKFADKKSFIIQLRTSNPGILAELRQTIDQLSSAEVRQYLLK
ncbi:MAG: hypothetical protein VX288_01100 [Planctomycetota bacterium]|nr:hypothetical protein [Planctomycetota bacterium]